MYDDDDAPPPLSSLPEQVAALQLKGSPADESQIPVASTTFTGPAKKEKPSTAIKKGFFDAKPKPKPMPAASSSTIASTKADDSIPLIKAQKDSLSGGTRIPDFLKVEPDEQEKRYQQVKTKLVEALTPTPDTLQSIIKDPSLLAGFEDPEVMAAVNEIAKDPSAMKKYKDNAKVARFYQAMAKVAGERLETMGDKKV